MKTENGVYVVSYIAYRNPKHGIPMRFQE